KALLAWMLAGPCHWHGLICGAIGSIIGRLRLSASTVALTKNDMKPRRTSCAFSNPSL
ncbi:MAG: hypothetical protein G8D58_13830, partial [gamma proteobacterium symbiont of Phacoides pectinatus]